MKKIKIRLLKITQEFVFNLWQDIVKISINNVDSIKSLLDKKIINKVVMSFDVEDNDK